MGTNSCLGHLKFTLAGDSVHLQSRPSYAVGREHLAQTEAERHDNGKQTGRGAEIRKCGWTKVAKKHPNHECATAALC